MNPLRYNGPAVFGVRPGHPLFFTLPLTGEGKIAVELLTPVPGIRFDPSTRRISGRMDAAGGIPLRFAAEDRSGRIEFSLEIVVGEEILLTPPMGWNSWYCFSESVSDEKVRDAARGMVERGLAEHGWNWINIDDCWQTERGGRYGALQGNVRFPDMKALSDYIHGLGLRFGIYSTPWVSTYGGFRGGTGDPGCGEEKFYLPPEQRPQPDQVFGRYPSGRDSGVFRIGEDWRFDADIRQWVEWEVDYVKVDWYPNDVPTTRRIAESLRRCGRDIVLSLSNNAPFEFAADLSRLAQLWRVTGDIQDCWKTLSSIGFDLSTRWIPYCRPGHWNDPDMLQIGAIGVPNSYNTCYRPTRLTREEQKLQLSLWCLLSAPLLLSCDLSGMDDFSLELLTNDEVLAIDQDRLAAPPSISEPEPGIRVYRKALADGSTALGIFNLNDAARRVDLARECAGAEEVRDLWAHDRAGRTTVEVASHGACLYRLK